MIILFACLLFVNVLPGLGVLSVRAAAAPEEDSGYAQISVFAKAVQLIRQDYVDSKKTSYHDLIYAAMKGMLASLDPHSQFMDEVSTLRTCRTIRGAGSTGSASRSR